MGFSHQVSKRDDPSFNVIDQPEGVIDSDMIKLFDHGYLRVSVETGSLCINYKDDDYDGSVIMDLDLFEAFTAMIAHTQTRLVILQQIAQDQGFIEDV